MYTAASSGSISSASWLQHSIRMCCDETLLHATYWHLIANQGLAHLVVMDTLCSISTMACVSATAEAARDLRAGRLPHTLQSLHPQHAGSLDSSLKASAHGFVHGKLVADVQGDSNSQCSSPSGLIGADYGTEVMQQEQQEDMLVQPPHTGEVQGMGCMTLPEVGMVNSLSTLCRACRLPVDST